MCRPAQMTAQLLILPIGPAGQSTIQLLHRRIERRAIVPPVILEPTPHGRVEHPGQILDRLVTAFWQTPASNLCPDGPHRLIRDCRAEIDEVFPLAILRPPRPKGIAEKIKLLVRVRPSPVIILSVDVLQCTMASSATAQTAHADTSPLSLGIGFSTSLI